jgi:hypothetical protein
MMRRWAFVVVGLLLAAGCGVPAGTDGSLVDDWPALPEPKIFVPAAGVCLPGVAAGGLGGGTGLGSYRPLDCGHLYMGESVHVGQFTGNDASRDRPPSLGDVGWRVAFTGCDRAIKEYVSGEWRGARLGMSIGVPNLQAWQGGARWYRCDVAETISLDTDAFQKRTGSLRGVLKGGSELAHGCFNPVMVKDDLEGMKPVDCGKAHRAEYAGVWTAPDIPYEDFVKNSARTHRGCLGVVAKFTKVPNDSMLQYRIGTIFYEPDWNVGDRGVRCFIWSDDKDLKRSMRGAGPKALPPD